MNVETADLAEHVRRGGTLPPEWYTRAERYDAELRAIFERTWQYAGPLDHVAEPGDYFTCRIGRKPIVVVRDRDGDLHAHVNVCRHRFCQVARGRGRRKTLQCPYHAWTYSLDGRLLGAPRSDHEADFERSELSLRSARVASWGPLVFVCLDESAVPLERWLAEIPARYEAAGLPLARLRWRARREYHMAVNWKTAVENILECYHCPIVHPSYAGVMDLHDYDLEVSEHYSVQSTRLRTDAATDGAYEAVGAVELGVYAFVWPNFMANVNPGDGHFHTNLAVPLSPQEMVMVNDFFFVDEISPEEADRYVDFQNQVSIEDIEPVEAVQVGLASGALPSGRLLLESEGLIQHFLQMVLQAGVDERS
jgi:choline monooxygenase